jgi:perosamine synthetase
MIKFPVSAPEIGTEELTYVTECVKSGWISSLGPFVGRFERAMAEFCGVKHAVATANGTVAIHLALAALGISRGDEVIVPNLTFVATANAVTYTGAKVVLADIDPRSWNIDPSALERRITSRTRAVIVVHLYGHPCDMRAIKTIARHHRLTVIEDAAEAHGAEYHGRMVGSLADVATFSFYANKTVTTGEGGMCLTNSLRLADRMRFLKDHAMSRSRRYFHPEVGFNYRLTALQAAVGLAQIERLPATLERKRRIAEWYRAALSEVPGITLPPEADGIRNSYWMYSILVGREYGLSRDTLAERLRERGVDTRPFFWPLHQLPPHKSRRRFPESENIARKGLNLPSSSTLTYEDVQEISGLIKRLSRAGRRSTRFSRP